MPEQTLRWLRENAEGSTPVFLAKEIPDSVLRELRARGLAIGVPGGVIVVRNPGDDETEVVRAVLWSIVEKLALRYAPAVVERDTAVRLHLGQTNPGPEIRIRQTTGTRWTEDLLPEVRLRIERGPVEQVDRILVGQASIPVDPAEIALLLLPLQFLKGRGLRDVALWLKSLVISRPAIVAAYRNNPRPVVLKRIEHIARDVGNEPLADQLADVLATEQAVRIGRGRTGVGRELIIPPLVAASPTTRRPWLDRLQVMMRESRNQIESVLEEHPVTGSGGDIAELLDRARAAKAYDAYHSSSIEGYRLTMDEVSLLFGGGPESSSAVDDLRSRMAVIGYGQAFETLLARFDAVEGIVALGTDLILDLYVDLFRPSVEAELVTADDLRGWRTNPVFIRNTLYVPPAPEKVPAMIDLWLAELDGTEFRHPLTEGILAHLWFVWIHPFRDGNGRLARFLMNAAFLNAGHPWRTVRVNERDEYFAALRTAQLDEDYAPFTHFISGLESSGG